MTVIESDATLSDSEPAMWLLSGQNVGVWSSLATVSCAYITSLVELGQGSQISMIVIPDK